MPVLGNPPSSRLPLVAVLCAAFTHLLPADTPLATASISGAGLTATVSATDGAYQIAAAAQGWTFQGSAGPLANVTVSDGNDSVGVWNQITFGHGVARISSIRLYKTASVVLFSTQYTQDSPNTDPFPYLSSYPQGLFTFNYSGQWCYQFNWLNNRVPWLFFDGQANTFILSPASNFMTSVGRHDTDGALRMPIDPQITTLPAGFTESSILAIGQGINSTVALWGQTLTSLTGKHRPANDSNVLLNQLSYWTDAGAAYYYQPVNPSQYVPQLLQISTQLAHASIPIGSMELDSWYYPKGSPASWTSNTSGMDTFVADSSLFPQGLSVFQKTLGSPLITHARWIDPSSPLRNQYQMSGNVAIDPKYWRDYASYMVSNNIAILEQDWLSNNAVTAFNLTDPSGFLDNMAAALASVGRAIVYCMPLGTHILQSSNYDNVIAVRVGNDALRRGKWDEVLFNSLIPSAVGLWPFADAFLSANAKDVLFATLTAGPVASGDPASSINAANISQAVRSDGVIVKPDVPILPTDATFLAMAQGNVAPVVASTYTDHNGSRTAYVLGYEPTSGALGQISFVPSSLGIAGSAYVFDYFNKTGSVLQPGGAFTDIVGYEGSYYIVAPIGPSGIAFLGDTNKFVSAGKKRIEQLTDDGAVHAVVRFASTEREVALRVYSPSEPAALAAVGRAGRPVLEGPGRYIVTVFPGPDGTASVDLRVSKNDPPRPHR